MITINKKEAEYLRSKGRDHDIHVHNKMCIRDRHRCSSYLDQHKYYTSKYIYVDGHEFRKLSFQQIIDDAFLSTFGRSLLYVSSSHEPSRGHRSMVTTDAYLPLNQNGYTIMEKSKNNKNYIHPYNYKPVYIPVSYTHLAFHIVKFSFYCTKNTILAVIKPINKVFLCITNTI